MREKYGLKHESSTAPASPANDAECETAEVEEVDECNVEQNEAKKDGDCSVM